MGSNHVTSMIGIMIVIVLAVVTLVIQLVITEMMAIRAILDPPVPGESIH